ncbi:MAG: histidine kinase [Terracidiphilus sp.]
MNAAPTVYRDRKSPRKPYSLWADFVRSSLWTVPGVAILILVLFLSIGKVHLSNAVRQFVGALIYSACIGMPSIVLLTWIGRRFSAAYPRLVVAMEAVALLCTATVGSLVAGVVYQVCRMIPRSEFWPEFRVSYPFAIVISLAVGLVLASLETMRHKLQSATLELRTRQVEQERANKLLAEARLSSLESRIHPHFLFNTLNSIASLIPSDPVRAEATVGKLASLLRFSLNANQTSLVPLEQELKVVRDYLEIESTRFGARLRYQIDVPEALGQVKVPPLALQSLVENSVKHVAAQHSAGATIRIAAREEKGRVSLDVIDDGPGFSLAAVSPDHGLGNLAARLRLLFDDAGQLDVTRSDAKTVVRISLPADI